MPVKNQYIQLVFRGFVSSGAYKIYDVTFPEVEKIILSVQFQKKNSITTRHTKIRMHVVPIFDTKLSVLIRLWHLQEIIKIILYICHSLYISTY